jgi:hypothetical protein
MAPPKLPPAKPKTPPAATPAASPTPEVPPADPQALSMEAAWQSFCLAYEAMGPKGTPEDRVQQWFTILSRLFPNRQLSELSAAEWSKRRHGSSRSKRGKAWPRSVRRGLVRLGGAWQV